VYNTYIGCRHETKLTITVSEAVYEGLHRTVGRRRISQFIEKLARPQRTYRSDIELRTATWLPDQFRGDTGTRWIGSEP